MGKAVFREAPFSTSHYTAQKLMSAMKSQEGTQGHTADPDDLLTLCSLRYSG